MTGVRLRLTAADPRLAGTPLAVRTYPAAGRGALLVTRVGSTTELSADPPQCGFVVQLPGGQVVTAAVPIREGDDLVELEVPVGADAHTVFTTAGSRVWGAFTDPGYRDCWIRLWRDTGDGWTVVSWPAEPTESAYDRIRYCLALPPGRHMAQTGGEGLIPKLTVLPEAGQVEITVRPAAGPTAWLATFVTSDDTAAEALSGYLACGAVSAAREVARAHADEGSMLTRIVRGYLEMYTASPRDTADPATADEAVILGWTRLAAGDIERARVMFHQAVALGVPTYPRGLRLLAAGLRRLADAVSTALLEKLTPLLDAAEPGGPTTVFAGTTPDRPSITANNTACMELPHPHRLSVAGPVPAVDSGMLDALDEDFQEAKEVLADVRQWRLTPSRWDGVSTVVDILWEAWQAADVMRFQKNVWHLEGLAPVRSAAASAADSPVPAPDRIRRIVAELSRRLAEHTR